MSSTRHHSGLVPLPTAAQMREFETACFDAGSISERVVMEAAGRAVAFAALRVHERGRFVVAVGKGNNGNDGIVAARTLLAAGREAVLLPVNADPAFPESLTHGFDLPIVDLDALSSSDCVIDALLGTGASGPPRPPFGEVIDAINRTNLPVVAIDGPSGVDLSTGAAPGRAIQATLTVAIGAIKRGLTLFPGRQHAGRILLAEVGFPAFPAGTWASLLTDHWFETTMPTPPPDTYKTRMGIVGVVAGQKGMAGAAVMSAMGALRAGAGGVRILGPESNRTTLQTAVPEALFFDSETSFEEFSSPCASLLLGPGMGTNDRAKALLENAISCDLPMILDADALTILGAGQLEIPRRRRLPVLTPHPGELARLLNVPTEQVLEDRTAAAVGAAERYGAVVLSKGSPSIIASPDAEVRFSTGGHSGIATGGMGDTLSGIAAALIAQVDDPMEAASLAIFAAGRAAEIAGRGRGLLPRDVADAIPDALERKSRREVAPFLLEVPPAR